MLTLGGGQKGKKKCLHLITMGKTQMVSLRNTPSKTRITTHKP
uniref:Uncharacterized protein n=1 Tax=Rhizophora mucronata TaxID=61149 RepID=A0A2P2IQW0_RHIMU